MKRTLVSPQALRQRKPLRCFLAAFRGNALSMYVTPTSGMLLRTMPVAS
jgi:hypothetical protein